MTKGGSRGNEGLSSIVLAGLCTALFICLTGALVFILLMPISNYHQASGIVDYRIRYEIVSRADGVITSVKAEQGDHVSAGDTLLAVSDEQRKHEADERRIRLRRLETEAGALRDLYALGAVDRRKVLEKEEEIAEGKLYLQSLKRDFVIAPAAGKLAYNTPVKDMSGIYVRKGVSIGYVFDPGTKQIRISFPNVFADRFALGAPVIFRHKDPASLLVRRMAGVIRSKFVDAQGKQVFLYCEVISGKEQFGLLGESAVVQASILVNSTSFAKDLFGIDLGESWFREWESKAFARWL